MAEYKETVTTKQDEGVDDTGTRVQQNTRRVDTGVSGGGKSTVANIVWYIVGFVEILLAFRFVLKLFGANTASGFVDFIYTITGVLTAPFDNIFGVTSTTSGEINSVFEPSILVAMTVYALIGWAIVSLLSVNRHTV